MLRVLLVSSFVVLLCTSFACGASDPAATTPEAPEAEQLADSAGSTEGSAAERDGRPRLGHGCYADRIDALVSSDELALHLRCACGDAAACEVAGTYVCHHFGQSAPEGRCDAAGILASNDLAQAECLPDSHLRGPEETYRQCVCGVEAACLALEETMQLHRYLGLDPGMPESDWFIAHEDGLLAIFE